MRVDYEDNQNHGPAARAVQWGFLGCVDRAPLRGSSPSKSRETKAVGRESLRGPYRHQAGKTPRPGGCVELSLGLRQMDRI